MNCALRLGAAPSLSHANLLRCYAQFRRDRAHKLRLEGASGLNRVRELHGGVVLQLDAGLHRARNTPDRTDETRSVTVAAKIRLHNSALIRKARTRAAAVSRSRAAVLRPRQTAASP